MTELGILAFKLLTNPNGNAFLRPDTEHCDPINMIAQLLGKCFLGHQSQICYWPFPSPTVLGSTVQSTHS